MLNYEYRINNLGKIVFDLVDLKYMTFPNLDIVISQQDIQFIMKLL